MLRKVYCTSNALERAPAARCWSPLYIPPKVPTDIQQTLTVLRCRQLERPHEPFHKNMARSNFALIFTTTSTSLALVTDIAFLHYTNLYQATTHHRQNCNHCHIFFLSTTSSLYSTLCPCSIILLLVISTDDLSNFQINMLFSQLTSAVSNSHITNMDQTRT